MDSSEAPQAPKAGIELVEVSLGAVAEADVAARDWSPKAAPTTPAQAPAPAPAAAAAAPAPAHPDKTLYSHTTFSTLALLVQVAMIVLFGTCTTLAPGLDASEPPSPLSMGQMSGAGYAMWQDVHVMIFVGFGFLYTLLRRYAWSGVAFNYFIAVIVIQFAILANAFWSSAATYYAGGPGYAAAWPPSPLNLASLVNADFVAGTVLISFGAVIGRVSATQMLLVALLETVFATANVAIGTRMHVTDPGGSMFIHVFGASFGLALAAAVGDGALRRPDGEKKLGTSRVHGVFAMVGTLFLFCFWPSFNAALLVGASQQRAVINTTLSICASAVVSFALSKAAGSGKGRDARFDMEHVQNATLAGGVAMGAACDMLANPWGALLAGSIAGAASTWGFSFLSPRLKAGLGSGAWALQITDTCGILNLHLIPGLIGGTAAAIAAAGITSPPWSDAAVLASFPARAAGSDAATTGGLQMAMTLITLAFGLASGALTGLIVRQPFAEPYSASFYEDAQEWNVPFDEEEVPEEREELRSELRADEEAREARARREALEFVVARLRAAGVDVGELPPEGAAPSAGAELRARRASPGAAPAASPRSANERFHEGSVRGGRKFFAAEAGAQQ